MRSLLLLPLVAAVLGAGCSALAPARMALPDPLADATALPFAGLGSGRQGEFSVDGRRVAFERGADRLSLFGVLSSDRSRLSFGIDGQAIQGRCDGRALQATIGVLDGALRPFGLHCRIEGAAAATLDLTERRSGAGVIAAREGQLRADGVTLQIRSVHALQGSAFQLAQPAGYVLEHDGRPVAALDLSERIPLLRRATAAPAVQRAVLVAAVALGLLWDPATTTP